MEHVVRRCALVCCGCKGNDHRIDHNDRENEILNEGGVDKLSESATKRWTLGWSSWIHAPIIHERPRTVRAGPFE
ncbi:hypothetical protein GCM10007394_23230 [Salinibacterium amurskyense]|nr:hypothetical protein GCM10007394_23230 [Salinibacterium amurskyense]